MDRPPNQNDRSEAAPAIEENLLKLIYFGSRFDVKSRSDFNSIMLTRSHERNHCLMYDYVTDDDVVVMLGEGDLDLISMMSSLLTSRPVDSSFSHQNALQRCIEHAKISVARLLGLFLYYTGCFEKEIGVYQLSFSFIRCCSSTSSTTTVATPKQRGGGRRPSGESTAAQSSNGATVRSIHLKKDSGKSSTMSRVRCILHGLDLKTLVFLFLLVPTVILVLYIHGQKITYFLRPLWELPPKPFHEIPNYASCYSFGS